MSATRQSQGSVTLTQGVRVAVAPSYSAEQSDPSVGRYVFPYRVRITNESDRRVVLRSRYWLIVDGDGVRNEVEGEGVVGHQPALEPGESFAYTSFCPLPTTWGTMEGRYTMEAGEERFEVEIGRFYLTMPAGG